MKEVMAFCVSMMLAGILLAEIRFGGIRAGRFLFSRDAKVERAADRKLPDNDLPPPPEEPGADFVNGGKPAPLQPRPGHYLVAANALPPGDKVYLLPKD